MSRGEDHIEMVRKAADLHAAEEPTFMATMRIMQSHDYGHFDATLQSTQPLTFAQADDLAKQAARLTDRAIARYKLKKSCLCFQQQGPWKIKEIAVEAEMIAEIPEKDRTPEQMAVLKRYRDLQHALQRAIEYDYQDDYSFDPDDVDDVDDVEF